MEASRKLPTGLDVARVDELVSLVVERADDGLDVLAASLTASVGAALDRVAAHVRALRPGDTLDDASLAGITVDVRAAHAAVEHLRALHPEHLSPRVAPELLDAATLARDVAAELAPEGLHVRVDVAGEPLRFAGSAPAVRRALRWMVERASATEGGLPWVALRVFEADGDVVFELPWFDASSSSTASAEATWIQRLVREQAGSFSVRGLRARASFPRDVERPSPTRDDDALAQEIQGLREQRAAHDRNVAALVERLHLAERSCLDARARAERLERLARHAASSLQRALEPLRDTAALLAERDPAGPEIQSAVQTALDHVRALAEQVEPGALDVVASGVGPRVHSDDPQSLESFRRAFEAPSTLPPMAEGDPDEADIPLRARG